MQQLFVNEDYIFLMNECLRVLKPGGIFEIQVPFWDNEVAFKDPTHCRFFCKQTFHYMEAINDWEYGFDKRWKVKVSEVLGGSQVHAILIAEK